MPSLRRERPKGSARQALDTLIDCESETLEALQAAIRYGRRALRYVRATANERQR